MKRPLAWLAGALGLAGAYRALKRRPEPQPALPDGGPDPRAEELRRRLEEAEPPADELEQPVDDADPDTRRRGVHERAQAAIDTMRRTPEDDRSS